MFLKVLDSFFYLFFTFLYFDVSCKNFCFCEIRIMAELRRGSGSGRKKCLLTTCSFITTKILKNVTNYSRQMLSRYKISIFACHRITCIYQQHKNYVLSLQELRYLLPQIFIFLINNHHKKNVLFGNVYLIHSHKRFIFRLSSHQQFVSSIIVKLLLN